jgi:hypothetical protein
MTFSRMGGVGPWFCGDCKQTFEVHSFTHWSNGCTTGYQCRTCGKLATRDYEQPFADDSPEHRIEHAQSIIRIIEHQMPTTPKEEWLSTWESDLRECREELSHVPDEELARIKSRRDQVDAEYAASLFCECGGPLDRDKVVFCPNCRSENLSPGPGIHYIT